jgi:hypothetical protein
MSEVTPDTPVAGAPATRLTLRPLHGGKRDSWFVHLDESILTLFAPDGRIVKMFPKDDAARHIRFDWDLRFGRAVTFMEDESFRARRFRCSRSDLGLLINWLPQRTPYEMEREVRHHGVVMVLIGVIQLLFQAYFSRGWGLAFVVEGLLVVLWSRRFMYVLNALLLIVAGSLLLFGAPPHHIVPAPLPGYNGQYDLWRIATTSLGGFMLLWSIHQSLLLSANHRLRLAKKRRSELAGEEDDDESESSRAVRLVLWAVGALAVFLTAHVAGLVLQSVMGENAPKPEDWVLVLTLDAVAVGAAMVLYWRPSNAYLEARVAGQYTVVLAVLYLAGVFSVSLEETLPFPSEILWAGLSTLSWSYVWAPIIGGVAAFNWWFSRAVEDEMDRGGS